jgi:hypothetical protein
MMRCSSRFQMRAMSGDPRTAELTAQAPTPAGAGFSQGRCLRVVDLMGFHNPKRQ